jgi:prevent-host-death family protein
MAFVGIRELSRDTSRVIREFEENGEPVVVTREGRPIGALVPISEEQLEDLALATAPQFRAPSVASGEGGETRPLREAATERGIDVEELREADAEAELEWVDEILREPIARLVRTAAYTEIAEVNREALAAVDHDDLQESEVRELTRATTAFYAGALRLYLRNALGQHELPPPDAVLHASHHAGTALREMNRSMIAVPDLSARAYVASMRAFEGGWKKGIVAVDEEKVVEAEAATTDLAEPAH